MMVLSNMHTCKHAGGGVEMMVLSNMREHAGDGDERWVLSNMRKHAGDGDE